MNRFEKLAQVLNKQVAVQKQLLDLEKKKTDVLLKHDVAQLDNLINEQQPLILSSSNLEKQREVILKEMNLQGKTLRQIIAENPDAELLNNSLTQLGDLVSELKIVSAKNNRILQSRLDFIGMILNKAGVATDQTLTYSK